MTSIVLPPFSIGYLEKCQRRLNLSLKSYSSDLLTNIICSAVFTETVWNTFDSCFKTGLGSMHYLLPMLLNNSSLVWYQSLYWPFLCCYDKISKGQKVISHSSRTRESQGQGASWLSITQETASLVTCSTISILTWWSIVGDTHFSYPFHKVLTHS